MNVLIIENEKPAADKLRRLLKNIAPSIIVAGVLETVEHSINWFLKNDSPDLILMDIQLDDGICFEIFESVKISTPIIFTTAYDEYAIRAFKVNSVDYLLKPITKQALEEALNKFKNLFSASSKQINEQILNHLHEQLGKEYKSRFFVKVGEHCKSIASSEIACFYIVERSTFFITTSGNQYDTEHSMEQLEKLLDPQLFFRVNRQMIVNINAITDIVTYSASTLRVKISQEEKVGEILISREKVKLFKKWLGR